MSKTYFRPSDDASTYPFNIPSNAMTVVQLRRLVSTLSGTGLGDDELLKRVTALADEIDEAIRRHGLAPDGVLAYEVDGYRSAAFMDDANVPSLLSLPYLGYMNVSDPIYKATRAYVLSDANPYYFKGSRGEGIGSPHYVGYGYIWHMSIVMQALTSTDDDEILNCLNALTLASADTGFMHESFWKDDESKFLRPWFAWANGLYGELILKLIKERPYLILKDA